MTNILVPLDGSRESECILPYLRSLGGRKDIGVSLLSINDPQFPFSSGSSYAQNWKERGVIVASQTEYLAGVARRLDLKQTSCWTVVGSLRQEVFRGAREQGAQLIVMPFSGQAEEVVRVSPCPVLIVRPPVPQKSTFSHILVPVDGSPESIRVCCQLELFTASETRVTLLTASGLTAQDEDYAIARGRQENFMSRLQDELRPICKEGFKLEIQIADGDVAQAILSYARAEGCDLIAMLHRPHSQIQSFLLGSITHTIVTEAPCSVLLFSAARAG